MIFQRFLLIAVLAWQSVSASAQDAMSVRRGVWIDETTDASTQPIAQLIKRMQRDVTATTNFEDLLINFQNEAVRLESLQREAAALREVTESRTKGRRERYIMLHEVENLLKKKKGAEKFSKEEIDILGQYIATEEAELTPKLRLQLEQFKSNLLERINESLDETARFHKIVNAIPAQEDLVKQLRKKRDQSLLETVTNHERLKSLSILAPYVILHRDFAELSLAEQDTVLKAYSLIKKSSFNLVELKRLITIYNHVVKMRPEAAIDLRQAFLKLELNGEDGTEVASILYKTIFPRLQRLAFVAETYQNDHIDEKMGQLLQIATSELQLLTAIVRASEKGAIDLNVSDIKGLVNRLQSTFETMPPDMNLEMSVLLFRSVLDGLRSN